MILARLLEPKDFGLVGMVTAFTGVLILFRDFGLSSAAIQQHEITEEQMSTLFWINLLVGALLGLVSVAMAPKIATFYHEPRLVSVTIVLAFGFLFNSMGVQHCVLLQRQMRFTTLAVINTLSLLFGTAVAIGAAKLGFGYWSLVAMSVASPIALSIGSWVSSRWVPGMPRRGCGLRSMMRFGSTLTANGLVVYLSNNMDKVFIGRYWGGDILGVYGRAYQLINIPTENLNSAAGEVAFSALSRLQHEPSRFRSYFLKGYSLVLAMTLPVTLACGLFADDLVLVVLGPKWHSAAIIFRLLAPTILAFAIINPLGWMIYSLGFAGRGLKMALVLAPVLIGSYALGLKYGPQGVAFACSTTMILWIFPAIAWAVHGTMLSVVDILTTISRPMICGAVSGVVALGTRMMVAESGQILRLAVEITSLLATYLALLVFATDQGKLYLELIRSLKGTHVVEEGSLAST